jgi:hypothetical protein
MAVLSVNVAYGRWTDLGIVILERGALAARSACWILCFPQGSRGSGAEVKTTAGPRQGGQAFDSFRSLRMTVRC